MAMAATKEYVDRRIAELSVVLSSELRASKDAIGPFLIRAVKFFHHPVLGDLRLNFCDPRGEPVDTVILAGENDLVKNAHTESIHRNIHGSQLKIIPGEGHDTYVIHNPKLYDIIAPFLLEECAEEVHN